jgi:hypothetical protein
VALAKLLREVAADVLFSPSPDDPAKTQLTCIVEALVDKAKQGDARAAELLFERVGGRPALPEENVSERGGVTIKWYGPPPPWAPKEMLDEYECKQREKYGPPPALPEAREPQVIEAVPSEAVTQTEALRSRTQPPQPAPIERSPVWEPSRIDAAILAYVKS